MKKECEKWISKVDFKSVFQKWISKLKIQFQIEFRISQIKSKHAFQLFFTTFFFLTLFFSHPLFKSIFPSLLKSIISANLSISCPLNIGSVLQAATNSFFSNVPDWSTSNISNNRLSSAWFSYCRSLPGPFVDFFVRLLDFSFSLFSSWLSLDFSRICSKVSS